jgi:hypothetical protein
MIKGSRKKRIPSRPLVCVDTFQKRLFNKVLWLLERSVGWRETAGTISSSGPRRLPPATSKSAPRVSAAWSITRTHQHQAPSSRLLACRCPSLVPMVQWSMGKEFAEMTGCYRRRLALQSMLRCARPRPGTHCSASSDACLHSCEVSRCLFGLFLRGECTQGFQEGIDLVHHWGTNC